MLQERRVSGLKRRFMARALLMLLCMTYLFSFGAVSVFADQIMNESDIEALQVILERENLSEITSYSSFDDDGNPTTETSELFKFEERRMSFNYETFGGLDVSEQKDIIKRLMRAFDRSDCRISPKGQQLIYDEIQANSSSAVQSALIIAFDDGADLFSALQIIKPFSGIIGVILGCLALFLIAALFASTVLDFIYLGVPGFQSYCTEKGAESGKSKPSWISYDAYWAMHESGQAMAAGKYRSLWWIYLKHRSTTYIVFFVSLLYLIFGQLGALIGKIMDLFGGLF